MKETGRQNRKPVTTKKVPWPLNLAHKLLEAAILFTSIHLYYEDTGKYVIIFLFRWDRKK